MILVQRLNGTKILVKGNHDTFALSLYCEVFKDILACHIVNKVIFSHIPIHTSSLDRFKGNVHGHLHDKLVRFENGELNKLYKNVCVEKTKYTPVAMDDLLNYFDHVA